MPATPAKIDVVTLGYVYDRPGQPPLAIGSRLSLPAHEARDLRAKRLVRFAGEAEADVVTAGPPPDRAVILAPPPAAPDATHPVMGEDGKPLNPQPAPAELPGKPGGKG